MFDKIIDMIIFIGSMSIGIVNGKYPIYPVAIMLSAVGILCVVLYLIKVQKGDWSAYISIARAAIGGLASTYPVIGHPVIKFLIWFSLANVAMIYLAITKAERIQRVANLPRPTTAIGRIKYKKEEKKVRRIFYRNPPKRVAPTFYVGKV